MSNMKDFVIERGVLKEYNGKGETVEIPDGVKKIAAWVFYKCKKRKT